MVIKSTIKIAESHILWKISVIFHKIAVSSTKMTNR